MYLGSEQAAVPWVQYNPGQTYTTSSSGTVNANAWGSGGYAYGTGNYYGTSTTTSPGTFSTQMIPVTVHRYQYEAGVFQENAVHILGVLPQPLPSEIRQQLERNTGVFAWVVRNGSPAFNANILEGDVILKINGEDVMSETDLMAKNFKFAGQKVQWDILAQRSVQNHFRSTQQQAVTSKVVPAKLFTHLLNCCASNRD